MVLGVYSLGVVPLAGDDASTVTATAAWTEGADGVAASGTTTVTSTGAWTSGDDGVVGAGTTTATGFTAWTEGADGWVGSGTGSVTSYAPSILFDVVLGAVLPLDGVTGEVARMTATMRPSVIGFSVLKRTPE